MAVMAERARAAGAAAVRIVPTEGETGLDAANYPPSAHRRIIDGAVEYYGNSGPD